MTKTAGNSLGDQKSWDEFFLLDDHLPHYGKSLLRNVWRRNSRVALGGCGPRILGLAGLLFYSVLRTFYRSSTFHHSVYNLVPFRLPWLCRLKELWSSFCLWDVRCLWKIDN